MRYVFLPQKLLSYLVTFLPLFEFIVVLLEPWNWMENNDWRSMDFTSSRQLLHDNGGLKRSWHFTCSLLDPHHWGLSSEQVRESESCRSSPLFDGESGAFSPPFQIQILRFLLHFQASKNISLQRLQQLCHALWSSLWMAWYLYRKKKLRVSEWVRYSDLKGD